MLVQVSVLIDGQKQAALDQELSGSAEEMEERFGKFCSELAG
jgi:hypothetical protein